MDNKKRVEIIRKGNELFNAGDIDEAEKLFTITGYKDGLTRIADFYFYDKKLPLSALKFYKMVKREDKVKEIYERMFFAMNKMAGNNGNNKEEEKEYVPPKISPKLKILAEEILRDYEEKNK